MYFNNPGMRDNFLINVIFGALIACALFSISSTGWSSMSQKVAAWIIGTNNITKSVALELKNNVSPAYDSAPITPAPPVPDDQVDITFLKMEMFLKN